MATTDIFAGHEINETHYKEFNGHKIAVGVYIPKNLAPGRYPLIVRFHGGFLITGAHEQWFEPWLMEFSISNSAIIVSPDYRMMPEGNGLDIMKDLSDLWEWVYSNLPKELEEGIEADFAKILVQGGSAGGYLAIQSVLSQGSKVAAGFASYAPVDLKIPFFTTAFEKNMVGFPMSPPDAIEKHVARLKGDEVVSTATPPARFDLAFGSIQQGQYVDLLGSDTILFPMERLDTVTEIAPLFILHGKADSAVPYQSSEAFAKKLKFTHPESKLLYSVVEGKEHGIDKDAALETEWLKEGLDFITPFWLGK